jgi:hypothetical protein
MPNPPEINPAQQTEVAISMDAERLRAEMPIPVGSVALAAETGLTESPLPVEATEAQVNPRIEHMKKVERAFFGAPDSLIKQIDDGELGVDDTDFEDRTAVMMMTAQGHTEAVKELLARNADVNRINMYQGRIPMSALDAARQTNRKDIEQLLLDKGAKSGRELQAERIAAE